MSFSQSSGSYRCYQTRCGCMNVLLLTATTSFSLLASPSAVGEYEALSTEAVSLKEQALPILQFVKTQADIIDARRTLSRLGERWTAVGNMILITKATDAEVQEVKERLKDRTNSADVKLAQELNRLYRLPNLMVALSETFPIKQLEASKRELASLFIRQLTISSEAYKAVHGNYALNLSALSKGFSNGTPMFRPEDLIDPWGRSYQYDVSGNNHKGVAPDIWSLGPPYRDPKDSIIGNWHINKRAPQ